MIRNTNHSPWKGMGVGTLPLGGTGWAFLFLNAKIMELFEKCKFFYYFVLELRNSTSFSTALPRCDMLFFSSEVISANVLS